MLSPSEMTREQRVALRMIVRLWLARLHDVEIDPPSGAINELLAALWAAWPEGIDR